MDEKLKKLVEILKNMVLKILKYSVHMQEVRQSQKAI